MVPFNQHGGCCDDDDDDKRKPSLTWWIVQLILLMCFSTFFVLLLLVRVFGRLSRRRLPAAAPPPSVPAPHKETCPSAGRWRTRSACPGCSIPANSSSLVFRQPPGSDGAGIGDASGTLHIIPGSTYGPTLSIEHTYRGVPMELILVRGN